MNTNPFFKSNRILAINSIVTNSRKYFSCLPVLNTNRPDTVATFNGLIHYNPSDSRRNNNPTRASLAENVLSTLDESTIYFAFHINKYSMNEL